MSVASRVNAETLEHIKEIAQKMKNHRATVMVGAGFSKNAEAILQTDKKFLDWNGLGDVFNHLTACRTCFLGCEVAVITLLKVNANFLCSFHLELIKSSSCLRNN